MKYLNTILIFLGIICNTNGQNFHHIADLINPQNVIVTDGLIFSPGNFPSGKSNLSHSYCETYLNKYFLNNILLSEQEFISLHLKQRNIFDSTTYFTCTFKNHDTSSCIEAINFYTSTKFPIMLNNKMLDDSKMKSSLLSQISQSQIISIKRRYPLFGKSYIQITTR